MVNKKDGMTVFVINKEEVQKMLKMLSKRKSNLFVQVIKASGMLPMSRILIKYQGTGVCSVSDKDWVDITDYDSF